MLLALRVGDATAQSSAADRCPKFAEAAGVHWSYSEGPDFDVCTAIRDADTRQLFGVYLGHAPSFNAGGAARASQGVVGGHAVTWYYPPAEERNSILIETVFDVPGSNPDYSYLSHVWVLPQRRGDLALTFRLLAGMRYP
jgi:hypothetical protein